MKETRLYVYPDSVTEVLYLLTLGDKKSQRGDISFCVSYVKALANHQGSEGGHEQNQRSDKND